MKSNQELLNIMDALATLHGFVIGAGAEDSAEVNSALRTLTEQLLVNVGGAEAASVAAPSGDEGESPAVYYQLTKPDFDQLGEALYPFLKLAAQLAQADDDAELLMDAKAGDVPLFLKVGDLKRLEDRVERFF